MIAEWTFDSRGDTEAVLRLEPPADIVDPGRPGTRPLHITYGYVLFAAVKPKP